MAVNSRGYRTGPRPARAARCRTRGPGFTTPFDEVSDIEGTNRATTEIATMSTLRLRSKISTGTIAWLTKRTWSYGAR